MSETSLQTLTRLSFRHRERLRVRWAEVDLQQIVFNGHYLMYFDTAVAGYWRKLALPYHDAMALLGGDLYVRKATVEYEASARFDDLLEVGIRCGRIGNSSMQLQAAVFRGERRLVLGELVYVFADPASQTARPVPAPLRELLNAFEAGESVFDVRSGGWDALGVDASALRQAVFVAEQGIAAELELDAADAQALHVVAYNRLGQALGTGRLLEHAPGVGRIGRMAVLASVREAGIGRPLLDHLIQLARERGDREVILHSQSSAIGFYDRAGFLPRGEAFDEAGIVHQEMALSLR
ncbi:MAG: YbgC/FadM family acyl-CoA thioesterase [Burkholderiaceae bacterium]